MNSPPLSPRLKHIKVAASALLFIFSTLAGTASESTKWNGLPPTSLDKFVFDTKNQELIYGEMVPIPEHFQFTSVPRFWPQIRSARLHSATLPDSMSQKVLGDALKDLSVRIKQKPNASIYIDRAWVNLQLHKYSKAQADCDKALQIEPANVYAFATRGLVELEQCLYGDAIADFSKALSLDDSFSFAYYYRGLAYKKSGEVELAKLDLAKAEALRFKP